MVIHIDYSPVKNCKHPEWTYGEICVKCNECGRFDKGGESNPIRSEVILVEQGYDAIPPFWRYPQRRAIHYKDKWWVNGKSYKESSSSLEEAMPECWHKRELEYVRWWIEGRNY